MQVSDADANSSEDTEIERNFDGIDPKRQMSAWSIHALFIN